LAGASGLRPVPAADAAAGAGVSTALAGVGVASVELGEFKKSLFAAVIMVELLCQSK
jgi:hypothetical protein